MTIAKYKVIQANDPNMLERAVNKFIKEGWQPFGGIALDASPENTSFYQTIVMEITNEFDALAAVSDIEDKLEEIRYAVDRLRRSRDEQ